MGWIEKAFSVNTDWFNGSSNIQTYQLEEMIGAKLRVLYQRKYGRDLYDISKALKSTSMNLEIRSFDNDLSTTEDGDKGIYLLTNQILRNSIQ